MSHKPKSFLIFAKPAIGDILLATPLMRSIRAAEPDAVIDVMCYPGQEGILEGNPDVDNIVSISQKPPAAELVNLLRRLFRKYDVAITNAADDRVHLYLLFFGKQRVSVTLKNGPAWKRWVVDASVQEGSEELHALLRNNQLGNLLGYGSNYEVRIPVSESAGRGRSETPARNANADAYAVIHPDARLPYKRWTRHGWLAVMQHLHEMGLKTYVTGGASVAEQNYITSLLQQAPSSVVNLAGRLRFAEVSELIGESQLYVGVDTVNSHLAAATGVPTIALFGPENPVRWGPWPKGFSGNHSPWSAKGTQRIGNVMIIQGNKTCDSCGQYDCQRRHQGSADCPLMTGIDSERVIDGIDDFLN